MPEHEPLRGLGPTQITGLNQSVAISDGEEDHFTAPLTFYRGDFNLSVSGTFAATVTLQRSFDNGDTWATVQTFTAPIEQIVSNAEAGVLWQLGCHSADYTSGTVNCRLGQ